MLNKNVFNYALLRLIKSNLFKGHYTTTLTICHTLYYVAKYPEIQNRIIEEQQCIFKNDMSKKPTHKNLNDMKYLEAVIKESMRVLPPVTKIGRQLKKDFRFDGIFFLIIIVT